MATSRCAWPSPIGEEMYSARLRRDLPRAHRRGAGAGGWIDSTNCRSSRFTCTGIAGVGEVAGALEVDEVPLVRSASSIAHAVRRRCVVVAGDHQHRAAHARAQLDERLAITSGASESGVHPLGGQDQRLGRRLQSPADAVLDLLGGVRLAERLREEELEEALVVAPPVVPVVLGPALVGVELVVEGVARPLDRRARTAWPAR